MTGWTAKLLASMMGWALGASAWAGPLDETILREDMGLTTDRWDAGAKEFSVMVGPYFGPDEPTGPAHDTFTYLANNFRLGINLTGILADGTPFRGNVQGVGELFLGEILEGGGTVMVGPNVLLRYNFIQPNWPVVPYVQLGPGLAFVDSDNSAIGTEFSFQLNIAVGARILLDPNWSVNGEFGWHHLSNADTADSNLGSNALGGLLGVSYFFK